MFFNFDAQVKSENSVADLRSATMSAFRNETHIQDSLNSIMGEIKSTFFGNLSKMQKRPKIIQDIKLFHKLKISQNSRPIVNSWRKQIML